MKEIWKDIEGYEGKYQVSNLGRVKSLMDNKHNHREMILKFKIDKGNYLLVRLSKNSKKRLFRAHRLVAQAFIPNPDNKPQVNHLDENTHNNIVTNLEWCTCEYNSNFGTRNERISKATKGKSKDTIKGGLNPSSRRVICLTTNEIFGYIREASQKYNISEKNIVTCCKGKLKSAGKHPTTGKKMVWEYLDYKGE